MNNPPVGPKVIGRDKVVVVSTVSNGFILQFTETLLYKNGKTEDIKQMFVAKLVEEAISGVRSFLEGNEELREKED